jgi:hypothetical protein
VNRPDPRPASRLAVIRKHHIPVEHVFHRADKGLGGIRRRHDGIDGRVDSLPFDVVLDLVVVLETVVTSLRS